MAHRPQDEIERILAVIRHDGGRVTGPRRAVVEALLGGDGHRSAEDIGVEVQRRHPDVALSTVYRTLDALERLSVIEHSHLGHGPAVYHLTEDAHVHLVCRSCGSVTDVPDETVAGLAADLHDRHGFELASRHFALFGICRGCAGGAPPSTS